MELTKLTQEIIGTAMKVHSTLGPGLLESAYEACLEYELKQRGSRVERQKVLPVVYENVKLDCGYRNELPRRKRTGYQEALSTERPKGRGIEPEAIDLLVERAVIVELKAVRSLAPIHEAQLLSYLKLSEVQVRLIINFNVVHLRDGIKRLVNNYEEPLRSSESSVVKRQPAGGTEERGGRTKT